jgi:hypothetical protein
MIGYWNLPRIGWLAAGLLFLAAPVRAVPVDVGGLKLEVQELAESVDLSRGQERFLTVTLEISGTDAARLRRVQPLRDDFQLLAGKKTLPCRWLRGGTLPDDASRLRFTLGFSRPPRGTRRVSLRANLPRLEGDDSLELALPNLPIGAPSQSRNGKGWSISVGSLEVRDYTPPALPEKGQFSVKSIPADTRVFRKATPDAAPAQAVQLSLSSSDVELYDPTLDVSGRLIVDQGPESPLLSALMRRIPSRATSSTINPFITGQFYFAVPPKGRVTGVILRLHRRPASPEVKTVTIPDLPVPGS